MNKTLNTLQDKALDFAEAVSPIAGEDKVLLTSENIRTMVTDLYETLQELGEIK